jgi:hypothetical protein
MPRRRKEGEGEGGESRASRDPLRRSTIVTIGRCSGNLLIRNLSAPIAFASDAWPRQSGDMGIGNAHGQGRDSHRSEGSVLRCPLRNEARAGAGIINACCRQSRADGVRQRPDRDRGSRSPGLAAMNTITGASRGTWRREDPRDAHHQRAPVGAGVSERLAHSTTRLLLKYWPRRQGACSGTRWRARRQG